MYSVSGSGSVWVVRRPQFPTVLHLQNPLMLKGIRYQVFVLVIWRRWRAVVEVNKMTKNTGAAIEGLYR